MDVTTLVDDGLDIVGEVGIGSRQSRQLAMRGAQIDILDVKVHFTRCAVVF